MPTAPVTGDASTRTVEEQFVDLLCTDQGLLDAEFDAIIAAEWPDPPTTQARREAVGPPGLPTARRPADRAYSPAPRPRPPGVGGWARQRSPPHDAKRRAT